MWGNPTPAPWNCKAGRAGGLVPIVAEAKEESSGCTLKAYSSTSFLESQLASTCRESYRARNQNGGRVEPDREDVGRDTTSARRARHWEDLREIFPEEKKPVAIPVFRIEVMEEYKRHVHTNTALPARRPSLPPRRRPRRCATATSPRKNGRGPNREKKDGVDFNPSPTSCSNLSLTLLPPPSLLRADSEPGRLPPSKAAPPTDAASRFSSLERWAGLKRQRRSGAKGQLSRGSE